jgi:hypothetical protein
MWILNPEFSMVSTEVCLSNAQTVRPTRLYLRLKRRLQINIQLNQLTCEATFQVYYLSFKYIPTRFEHPHAHHQELQQLQ